MPLIFRNLLRLVLKWWLWFLRRYQRLVGYEMIFLLQLLLHQIYLWSLLLSLGYWFGWFGLEFLFALFVLFWISWLVCSHLSMDDWVLPLFQFYLLHLLNKLFPQFCIMFLSPVFLNLIHSLQPLNFFIVLLFLLHNLWLFFWLLIGGSNLIDLCRSNSPFDSHKIGWHFAAQPFLQLITVYIYFW